MIMLPSFATPVNMPKRLANPLAKNAKPSWQKTSEMKSTLIFGDLHPFLALAVGITMLLSPTTPLAGLGSTSCTQRIRHLTPTSHLQLGQKLSTALPSNAFALTVEGSSPAMNSLSILNEKVWKGVLPLMTCQNTMALWKLSTTAFLSTFTPCFILPIFLKISGVKPFITQSGLRTEP